MGMRVSTSFNPGSGFRSVATAHQCRSVRCSDVFQSRFGFSIRRDRPLMTRHHLARQSFNPGSGFRSVATAPSVDVSLISEKFQSRFGFSIRRDVLRQHHQTDPKRVSIPVRVFDPSRRAPLSGSQPSSKFQSRFGFSIRRDRMNRGTCSTPGLFQSRFGFSIRRDVTIDVESERMTLFQSRFGFSIRRDAQC